jgi:cellobiose-specific phosphotransferase system component IIB
MPADIDILPTQKSLIDLSELPKNSFNSVFYGYNLKSVLDDVLLVKYADETEDGTSIMRNGIVVPINADTKAWRIGEVILCGPSTKYVKKSDYVCFPNNLGVPVANLDIEDYGTLKKGLFLNEQRIFGICSLRQDNESVASHIKKSPSKQRSRD